MHYHQLEFIKQAIEPCKVLLLSDPMTDLPSSICDSTMLASEYLSSIGFEVVVAPNGMETTKTPKIDSDFDLVIDFGELARGAKTSAYYKLRNAHKLTKKEAAFIIFSPKSGHFPQMKRNTSFDVEFWEEWERLVNVFVDREEIGAYHNFKTGVEVYALFNRPEKFPTKKNFDNLINKY